MTARFIGVQLEIESPRPLGHLFDSFSGAGVVSVDYRESTRGFAVAFEHARSGMSTDPDVHRDTSWGSSALVVWNGAYRKTFNVGYEIDAPRSASLRAGAGDDRIARVGASVIVAIYPRDSGEPASEG